jgi:hypothetical protein
MGLPGGAAKGDDIVCEFVSDEARRTCGRNSLLLSAALPPETRDRPVPVSRIRLLPPKMPAPSLGAPNPFAAEFPVASRDWFESQQRRVRIAGASLMRWSKRDLSAKCYVVADDTRHETGVAQDCVVELVGLEPGTNRLWRGHRRG